MMLLHIGDRDTTLVSLPRDSYLPIPGHGADKLNAAFADGGPKLLAETIEQSSGLRIDHYAEIGFGGFVGMVDAVGGVRMCIETPVRDKKAGIDLRAGCQRLDGRNALGYVRSRHAFAGGDLDRVKHQQQFLAALVHRATSPGALANPVRIVPFVQRAAAAVSVADGDHLWDLASFAWVMRKIAASGGDDDRSDQGRRYEGGRRGLRPVGHHSRRGSVRGAAGRPAGDLNRPCHDGVAPAPVKVPIRRIACQRSRAPRTTVISDCMTTMYRSWR